MGTQSLVGTVRRPDVLGVHSIAEFGLIVPDLGEAERFYSAFGLEARPLAGHLALGIEGQAGSVGLLSEGPRKALHHLAFATFEEDLGRFEQLVAQRGIARLQDPAGGDALWIADPNGLPVCIRAGAKTTPDAKAPLQTGPTPANRMAAPIRGTTPPVKPSRLSHLALFTADLDASIAFYRDVLGLRLSDRSAVIAFMHAPHGSDHHLIALIQSDGPGMHHCSWAVPSIDALGLGAVQSADAGYTRGWGLGRHVLGSNYFHYVRDPWGSYSEYSADIDYIAADFDWEARFHAPENSFYLWGPEPPEDFVTNFETINT